MKILITISLLCALFVVHGQENDDRTELLRIQKSEEKEIEQFTERTKKIVTEKGLPGAYQLRDETIMEWGGNSKMTFKKLYVILGVCSKRDAINDVMKRNALLLSIIRNILDQGQAVPFSDHILAVGYLRTNTDEFPIEGIDEYRKESNALFIASINQWAVQIIPKEQLPKSVTTNIYPGGTYPAGVSPEFIKEPEIRARYELAIAEERRKHAVLKSQSTMDNSVKLYYPLIFRHMSQLNAKTPDIKRDVYNMAIKIPMPDEQKEWLKINLTSAFNY
jgi:hypothetical protein